MTKSRESETMHDTREDVSRDDPWLSESALTAPPAREGFTQRWVSTAILGDPTPQNVSKRFREGWMPRMADTVPDNFFVTSVEHGKHEGAVCNESMILCELPLNRLQKRKEFHQGKTDKQTRFVEENLNSVERQGGHRIFREESHSVSHGQRRIADD